MKKGLTIFGLFVVMLVGSAAAMPMYICTPEEIADILMKPTYRDIDNMKADLISGDISFEQWKMQMYGLKLELEIKTVLLEAIRDSQGTYQQKIEALLKVFPWNIRGGIAHGDGFINTMNVNDGVITGNGTGYHI